jgi:eukaryotic-like serine/threonine-protein kinase
MTGVSASEEEQEFLGQLGHALGDDYRVDRLIGQGGFGRVYAGADVRLGRDVAIKVIRPELAGARAFVERFRKEGTALAKFRHPGIVPIYDIREHQGLIYYIMPLIDGETLRSKLDRGRVIPPKSTQRILLELTDCLGATHRAGIVHRDIKPDNVILEGLLGKTLLMDFGISKSISDLSTTVSGMVVGTPTYMSPEQATGEGFVDPRSDIYSLGVLAYHMLTGRPPFVGASSHAVIASHIAERPTPIRKLNPSVPRGMADAIEKCLAKEPADRFQSAGELAAALEMVTFASDADLPAPPRTNLAMPFFGGVAIEAAIYAWLSAPVWWFVAGASGALAILLSPVARAATEPLNDELRLRFALLRERVRRRQVAG